MISICRGVRLVHDALVVVPCNHSIEDLQLSLVLLPGSQRLRLHCVLLFQLGSHPLKVLRSSRADIIIAVYIRAYCSFGVVEYTRRSTPLFESNVDELF